MKNKWWRNRNVVMMLLSFIVFSASLFFYDAMRYWYSQPLSETNATYQYAVLFKGYGNFLKDDSISDDIKRAFFIGNVCENPELIKQLNNDGILIFNNN